MAALHSDPMADCGGQGARPRCLRAIPCFYSLMFDAEDVALIARTASARGSVQKQTWRTSRVSLKTALKTRNRIHSDAGSGVKRRCSRWCAPAAVLSERAAWGAFPGERGSCIKLSEDRATRSRAALLSYAWLQKGGRRMGACRGCSSLHPFSLLRRATPPAAAASPARPPDRMPRGARPRRRAAGAAGRPLGRRPCGRPLLRPLCPNATPER